MSTPELEALIEEAIAHVNAGDMEQGRTLLEQVLEQDPKNDGHLVNRLLHANADPITGADFQLLDGLGS